VSGQPTSSDQQRRQVERRVRLVQWVLLVVVVLLTTLPTVILDQRSRVFLLKVVIAAILTFLPGWLYLQFIKFKGRSLYDEFVLNLFRLRIDKYCNLPAPPQHTSYYHEWKKDRDALLADADVKTKDNLYRRKFEAIFGRNAVSTASLLDQPGDRLSVRDRTEAFSPVLVATLLIGVGWTLVVQPEFLRTFDFVSRLSGEPQVPYKALQYGFLGAYWFILQDLIRRYFRDDLKTGAYISAAARIVIVALIVTAVGLIPFLSDRPEQQQIFAFFVGIFPQIGLQALKAALTKLFGGVVPTVKTEYPLSDLDGLSIWDQARLLEEASRTWRTSPPPTWSTSCCEPASRSPGWWTGSTRRSCSCTCPTPRKTGTPSGGCNFATWGSERRPTSSEPGRRPRTLRPFAQRSRRSSTAARERTRQRCSPSSPHSKGT
jgi:hypothetical protein